MLANTREWLLARRDGQGGFSHERRALHTWVADPGCSNGYCIWALLECGREGPGHRSEVAEGPRGLRPQQLRPRPGGQRDVPGRRQGRRQDPHGPTGDPSRTPDGHVRGATTTIVGSGGESLEVETTSLAVLAWLRDPAYAGAVEKAMHFLADSCKAGRFGTTQSTVLALRAIVAYDKARAHPDAAGKVQLFVDGKAVGDAVAFDADTHGAIKLPDMGELMTPGRHEVELRMAGGSSLPYAVAVSFHSETPSSSGQCKVGVETKLARRRSPRARRPRPT